MKILLDQSTQERIEKIEEDNKFNPTKTQAEEILQRYGKIKNIMQHTVVEADPLQKALFTEKLDNILLHRFGDMQYCSRFCFYYFKVYFG